MALNKTLCSAAWYDLNIDFGAKTLSHCCKSKREPFPEIVTEDFFNNSTHIQNLRKDLVSGVENSACNFCWNSYKETNTAYRDFKNKWTNVKQVNRNIDNIEITLDNICDMACVYCDATSSSRIAQELGHKKVMNVPDPEHMETFIDWFEKVAIKQPFIPLSFLGGEISYSKNFYKFMELILEKTSIYNKNINFSVLTNGNATAKNQKKLLDLFDRLPSKWGISLGISNEATGEVAEAVRYGLDWNRFQSNFKDYINHPRIVNVTLAPTPNIFTLKHMNTYFLWVIEQLRKTDTKLAIFGNWVNWPNELDPARLDSSYKAHVKETLKIIKDNKDLFLDDGQYSHTYKWLEQLHNRIGTQEQNDIHLDNWISNIAAQKKDSNLLKLREYI